MNALMLLAVSLNTSAIGGGLRAETKGECHLVTKSRWHDLDLRLKVQGKREFGQVGLQSLAPKQLLDGRTWKVAGKELRPLATMLAGVTWMPTANAAAYRKWHGQNLKSYELVPDGMVELRLEKGERGFRVRLKGKVVCSESGRFASRWGPNTWEQKGTYQVEGTLELTADGQVTGMALGTEFTIAGKFYTVAAKQNMETFEQKGKLRLGLRPPKPLDPKTLAKVKAYIRDLGSEDFDKREQATKALLKLDESVAPFLREALTNDDPEVRRRSAAILERLK